MIKFNTGNFTLNIEGELNEESKAQILENGLRYAVQRDVATGVYLAVAGEKKEGNKNPTLPKGFERDRIPFTPETAEQFRTAAEAELSKLGTFMVEVVENVGGEGAASPMKRATALVDTLEASPEVRAAYAPVFALHGVEDYANASRETLIEVAHKAGLGIQPPKAKKNGGEKA